MGLSFHREFSPDEDKEREADLSATRASSASASSLLPPHGMWDMGEGRNPNQEC